MKFKVGDKVIGNDKNRYCVTRKGWIGTVTKINYHGFDPEDDIKVNGKEGEFSVCSKYFDLYEEGESPREDSSREFKVGDRVRYNGKGEGTIVCDDGSGYLNWGVEFDRDIKGHDCDGHAKKGHGWYCDAEYLTKIETPSSEPKVGDTVKVTGGEWRPNETGVLVKNDGTVIPYLVRFSDGNELWIKREHLVKIETPSEKPEGEWRVVHREPRVGDYIRLTDAVYTFSEVGDILKVSAVVNHIVKVKVCDHPKRENLYEPSDGSGDWNYHRKGFEVVERVGGDGKRVHSVLIDELPEKPRSEFYNGKVVCISKAHQNAAYTVGKVYEFKDGVVKLDNGELYPSSDPVKSIKEFNERRVAFGKFAPLIEDEGDGFAPHLECYGNDYGKIGKPTKFTDKDGNALLIGDIVRISSAGLTIDSVVCNEGKGAFVMGIESSCNEEKNTFGEWSVRKVRPWQDVEDGTLVARVRFIKSPKN